MLEPVWTQSKIGDVCLVGDGAHASIKRVNDGVLYLSSKNLKDGKLDLSKVDYITHESFEKHFRISAKAVSRPRKDDVIFGIIGSIGEAHLVRPDDHFGLSSSVAVLRPNIEVVDPNYLFCWVRGHLFKDALYAIKGGVAQSYISLEMIRSLPFNYPPLETQRQIAAILSAYDNLIENNARRIKVLEETAGLIYREWFVNFRFPGHECVRRVASELGEIPEGWRAAKLGDIAEQVRRNIQPNEVSKETPYIGLEHLPRKSIAFSEWAFPDSVTSSKLRFYQGEILFGKIRPYFHKVGVAPVDGICSSDIIVIRPRNPEFAAFTAMVTSSEDFVLQSVQTSQGTKMPRANWDVLVKYPVFLPDSALLERFNGIAANIVSQIRTFVFKNQNLRRTRDLLLPKLISGELDVSGLGADPEDVQDLADLRAAKAAEGESPALSLDELKLALEQG